ncbi:MAG TPA: DUF3618 domain-containing protein [Ornithinibacter sp.]|nr:DUF3618 domain-containing protein [Ornithinibacter sp.]
MSPAQPTADASSGAAATVGTAESTGAAASTDAAATTGAAATPAPPPSIPTLEAEISARRDRLAQTIDELTYRVHPKTIIHRQAEAAKARFADVATTPEGELRVERLAAVVAVVAVVGGWLVYRRLRRG